MNILIIHNFYAQYGGEDNVVQQQVELLRNKGHNVFLYKKSNNDISEFSRVDKLKLMKSAYSNEKTKMEIRDIIENFKPQVAHVHNIYPLISPSAYQVLYEKNIPVVQTLHNYRFICPNGLLYINEVCEKCLINDSYYNCFFNKCYRESYIQSFWYADIISKANKSGLFQYITKFIALNPFMKEKMIQKGFDEQDMKVIPNFVAQSKITDDLQLKEDYYLFIGRLSREKGVSVLIEAFKKLKDCKLKIIGDGPLKVEAEKVIQEHKLKNIELLGFKNGSEKVELMQKAKAIIVPSTWYENFPTVILEAFSLGTPVLASRTGGLQYMIEDDLNGYLFNVNDPEDIVEKVEYLESNKNLLPILSKNSYSFYKEKYTPEVHYHSLINFYRELAK